MTDLPRARLVGRLVQHLSASGFLLEKLALESSRSFGGREVRWGYARPMLCMRAHPQEPEMHRVDPESGSTLRLL
jgi:hypothetical protein